MPQHLLDRLGDECVRQFRIAAADRLNDALALKKAGRRMAGLYLCGYSIELVLKASYFSCVGFTADQLITSQSRRLAMANMRAVTGINAQNQHHLIGWANLLVQTRATHPVLLPLKPMIGAEIINRATAVYSHLWREHLRYHCNRPYDYEVDKALECANWYLTHYNELTS
jgi:hypothetical protein